MSCWICGKKGDSREHLIKASDIKGYFGIVSKDSPVYTHNNFKRNIPICSTKSNRFKSKSLICQHCNNALTQPHDRAWELLSNYIIHNYPKNTPVKRINLSKVFPGRVNRELINIQLYFVKLFGCRIVDNGVPIDISSFSKAILNGCSHDEVYLNFCGTPTYKSKYAGITNIQVIEDGKDPVWCEWIYTVGHLSVKVLYLKNTHKMGHSKKYWHPNNQSKVIKIYKL